MLFVQHLLNGLLAGAYYLLIALGLSLIFSLGGIVNLAHGAFYALGAYLTVVISDWLGLGFGGALIVSPIAVALIGILFERFLFRRFYRSDPILSLLLTFGLAMVAEQGLRMVFGAPPISYAIPQELKGQIFIGSFVYSKYRTILLGIAIVCIALLWLLLNKTAFGRVVRAGVQNPDMVGALGISLEPYMASVAALGIGLAGLAGVLLAPIYSIHPAMGQEVITPAFVTDCLSKRLSHLWDTRRKGEAKTLGRSRGLTLQPFRPTGGPHNDGTHSLYRPGRESGPQRRTIPWALPDPFHIFRDDWQRRQN